MFRESKRKIKITETQCKKFIGCPNLKKDNKVMCKISIVRPECQKNR